MNEVAESKLRRPDEFAERFGGEQFGDELDIGGQNRGELKLQALSEFLLLGGQGRGHDVLPEGVISGPSSLRGGTVESPDIRAGMAMLLAALAAEGKSTIHNIGQIDRGYERIDARLIELGAAIERVDD